MKSTKSTKSTTLISAYKNGFELKYDAKKRVKISAIGKKIIVPSLNLCTKKYI